MADPIPQLDLKAQYQALQHELGAALQKVLSEQKFVLGPEVAQFEREFAAACGAQHTVACASGSDALLLALMALDLRPGDAVACPAYTFFATAGSIARLGLRIVFSDVDAVTFNMTPETLARALHRAPPVKAVIPVHLFGQACAPELAAAIRATGARVVHDAAQAIGAEDASGRRVGGDAITCFSFYPTKNLGCYGDGGALTTGDAAQAERLRRLRAHGGAQQYAHDEVGINSRLDTLQAAVLRVKLPHLAAWNAARALVARAYEAHFAAAGAADSRAPLADGGLPLRTPAHPAEPARHVWNQYVVRVPAALRDELRAHLTSRGIGTSVYYPRPLHQQPCFASAAHVAGELPVAEALAHETLALPIYPELSDEQIARVAGEVIAFLKR
jgi:dTDP-4-amino-4,6-dideoxygalactose transaminase